VNLSTESQISLVKISGLRNVSMLFEAKESTQMKYFLMCITTALRLSNSVIWMINNFIIALIHSSTNVELFTY
jgi:hypothetical protein